MKGKKKVFVGFIGFIVLIGFIELAVLPVQAHALIVINEFLADPASGLPGDANSDGVGSSTQDEFIEVLNYSGSVVNLSGWYLSDNVKTRHTFSPNTFLPAYSYIAVFAGGSPNLPGINWQTASSGGLGLNNSGDTVSLFELGGGLIDQVVYGSEGGQDQSLALYEEGIGSGFVLHSSLALAGGKLFSPGTSIEGNLLAQESAGVVPEPLSIITFLMGTLGLIPLRARR